MGKDTFQLFRKLPSVGEGMARVLNIAGTAVDDGYIISDTVDQADSRAIGSDWSAVMGDMRHVAGSLGKPKKS